jgi:hypothetical protein
MVISFVAGLGFAPIVDASSVTVTNVVSWQTEPANIESYKIEKQTQTNGDTNAPWIALPSVPAGTKQFTDAGNAPAVTTCYRVTPTNTLPSTGAPATKCSLTIGIAGPMPDISIQQIVVPAP